MIDKALLNLCPESLFSVEDNDYSTIRWDVNNVDAKPTEAEVNAKIAELQAEYDAQEYARNRKPEYPDIGDQLDDLYHKGAFSDEMAVKIKAVKDAHPKPE